MRIRQLFINASLVLFCIPLLGRSTQAFTDPQERVRAFTRQAEFDYITWTADAFWIKGIQAGVTLPRYLRTDEQIQVIQYCLTLTGSLEDARNELERIFADPSIIDPSAQAEPVSRQISDLQRYWESASPICESILQSQLSDVITREGLSLGGQPIPPVLYHITPLPYALIISPRSVIQEDANISLNTTLQLEDMMALEKDVENGLGDVSALVVPVGGIGVYPTMVMSTTSLDWLIEVVAHEWTHNFLTLRPLGLSYDVSPELRTMNETAASLAGKELGSEQLKLYFPSLAKQLSEGQLSAEVITESSPSEPPPFDFRKEMHNTRVEVDRLLASGEIEKAERFMEARRLVFWENGYQIRRLNQAYFAFHGAYADEPLGAAGEDPVGPAVRALRAQSDSLGQFLNRISWLTSYEDLQTIIK
jgi:hypothetical protein